MAHAQSQMGSLYGNWFKGERNPQSTHEGIGPWPAGRGAKHHLARYLGEVARQGDEVGAKDPGRNHRFFRCDFTEVVHLADERMVKDRMGRPGHVGMKLIRGDVFESCLLFEIHDGGFDASPVPVKGLGLDGRTRSIGHKPEVAPVGEEFSLVTSEPGTTND